MNRFCLFPFTVINVYCSRCLTSSYSDAVEMKGRSPSETMRGDPSCLNRGVDAALGRVEREEVVAVVNVQRGVLSRRIELPS